MRLDQFLVQANICSRSEAKKIIKKGRVCVNGQINRDNSDHIDESADLITVDGKLIEYSRYHYYMLNKPAGCVSATRDGLSTTVIELLKGENVKNCFPVGRLDKDTEGLLIITDDGKLAHELLSPKHHVNKVYEVIADKKLSDSDTEQIEGGMDIGDDKLTLPASITYVEDISEGVSSLYKYELTICEGRFHQVKRMFEKCGSKVVYLKRIAMGPLELDVDLEPGKYRILTEEEIELLSNC